MLHTDDFILKKNKTSARMWCGQCDTEKTISLDLARQVEKASICPCCFSAVNLHKGGYTYENAELVKTGETGHYYIVRKRLYRKPFVYHKQVAYWNDDGFYARNIYMSMYQWVFRSDRTIDFWYENKADRDRYKKWRKRRTNSWNSLELQFFPIMNMLGCSNLTMTKKQWLGSIDLPEFKSNQKKIIIDNLLNVKQMKAIQIFDLKTVKDVYKYNSWIKKQSLSYQVPMNIYYLDYLYRNKIRYVDYIDYLDQCEMLNIKAGKPKDFDKVHRELSTEVRILEEKEENKTNDKLIKDIYKKLKRKKYQKGDILIRPHKNSEDLIRTGATLHNCIGGYIQRYAKGVTDLYVLIDNGHKKVAIEVKRGKLIQVRADHNREPDTKYKRIVNRWYKENYAKGTA